MNDQARLDFYTSIVPNARQKAFCDTGFHAFIHYGMTTFTGKEWGDGKTPPSQFNPTNQDAEQWITALKAAGAKGAIITAKHHDGFCLWPTKTTEYCVRNSPYKNGQGDVVREVCDACKKHGLKFGIYLSPWDRNSQHYGTPRYNDFYIDQLTELLTGYGDIFCVWLDGACGSYMDGKERQVYDFPRIYETVYRLQPGCSVSGCGPDVRWVGNEGGFARKSEWNVVPAFSFDLQTIADNSQQADDAGFKKKAADIMLPDLGSREALAPHDNLIWYPAEVDVSIRPGWFYHKKEDKKIRSLNNLLNIYYTSVGGNSLLLLNAPPSTEGRLAQGDVERLKEMGDAIREGTTHPARIAGFVAPQAGEDTAFPDCLSGKGIYTPADEADTYEFVLKLKEPTEIDKLLLMEDCDYSQRIESYDIYTSYAGKECKAMSGTTVGFRRYALFRKPVLADTVRLVITSCRKKPYLKKIAVLKAGALLPKAAWYEPVVNLAHRINYLAFITMENFKNKK